MKYYLAAAIAAGLMASSLNATATDGKSGDELTLSGKLTKDKANYVLTTSDNVKVNLPESKELKASLEKLVGKNVKLEGRGRITQSGKDKKIAIQSLKSVQEEKSEKVRKPKKPKPPADDDDFGDMDEGGMDD